MKVMIKEARQNRGITQRALAQQLGISQPYLAQIERGERRLNNELQKKIGDELGVPPSALVDFDAPDEEEERLLMMTFRKLTRDQREVWLRMARASAPEKSDDDEE